MQQQHVPSFKMFTGCMFSGKTSKLLVELDRCKWQKRRYVAFKPDIDTRYSETKITSHTGASVDAVLVKDGYALLEHLADVQETPQVIAVDEAFMLKGVADTLIFLFRNGFDVVVSSLQFSSTLKPFVEIQKILPWATHIEKCSAVCSLCGKDASYTYKKNIDEDLEIQIGGKELYEPRCAICHPFFKIEELVEEEK